MRPHWRLAPAGTALIYRRDGFTTLVLLLFLAIGFGLELNAEAHLFPFKFAPDSNFRISTLYQLGALYRPGIAAGEYHRLLTAILLHANWSHLLFNCLALAIVGWQVESMLGWWRTALIFGLSGLGANIFSLLFSLQGRQLAVGASGAIFGLMGAWLSIIIVNSRGQGWRWLLALALIVANGLILSGVSGTDNWAHLSGLISGFWLGLAANHPANKIYNLKSASAVWIILLVILLVAFVVNYK